MVAYGVASDKGALRPSNQDAGYVAFADTSAGEMCLAVVCDGVGGLRHGEVASENVVRGFSAWFHSTLPRLIGRDRQAFTLDAAEDSWRTLLATLNDGMYRQGLAKDCPHATTCTAVLVFGGSYLACQVGDSRLYKVNERGCVQLTCDQTLVSALVAAGEIMPGEVEGHPAQHVIMQAVGAAETLAPEFSYGAVDDGDLLVACTDGAYRHADGNLLFRVFCEELPFGPDALNVACRSLLDICLGAGETDNLTAVCVAPYGQVSRHSDTVVVG